MSVKLLTEYHLEFLSLKGEATKACLSLHLSKCHVVGNHMSRLMFRSLLYNWPPVNQCLLGSCVPFFLFILRICKQSSSKRSKIDLVINDAFIRLWKPVSILKVKCILR